MINWKTDLGKLLSWVSFCYLFWLRVPVFNKIVFSFLCVFCQCPGNIIASDDFAVKLPSLETHCYISPEHFHLAWILVPRLQIHSVFFVVYQKKGGHLLFPIKKICVLKPPLFKLFLQRIKRCSMLSSISILTHCLSSVCTVKSNSRLCQWSWLPYQGTANNSLGFSTILSHTSQTDSYRSLQGSPPDTVEHCSYLLLSVEHSVCLFLIKISTVFSNDFLSRRPR